MSNLMKTNENHRSIETDKARPNSNSNAYKSKSEIRRHYISRLFFI
jgi:hypothetical protein